MGCAIHRSACRLTLDNYTPVCQALPKYLDTVCIEDKQLWIGVAAGRKTHFLPSRGRKTNLWRFFLSITKLSDMYVCLFFVSVMFCQKHDTP